MWDIPHCLNQLSLHCAVLLTLLAHHLDVLARHQLHCADESQEDETAVR